MVQALLQQVESPKASLRMLCAFTAMHMGMDAGTRELPAQQGQTQAVVEKLLHVLLLPACTLTASGILLLLVLETAGCYEVLFMVFEQLQ